MWEEQVFGYMVISFPRNDAPVYALFSGLWRASICVHEDHGYILWFLSWYGVQLCFS